MQKGPNGVIYNDNGYLIDLGKASEFFQNSCIVLYEVADNMLLSKMMVLAVDIH